MKLYDKLGKYLHADNPWGGIKDVKKFLNTLQKAIKEIEVTISLYSTIIRTPDFQGMWIVKTTLEPITVEMIVASTDTDFSVKY